MSISWFPSPISCPDDALLLFLGKKDQQYEESANFDIEPFNGDMNSEPEVFYRSNKSQNSSEHRFLDQKATLSNPKMIEVQINFQKSLEINNSLEIAQTESTNGPNSHQQFNENDAFSSFQNKELMCNGKKKNIFKKKKVRKCYKNKYPTKNFLQSFRSHFLEYIRRNFGNDEKFNKFQIIKRIQAKKNGKKKGSQLGEKNGSAIGGINKQDYQDLFNQQDFRNILETYFKNKVIVRDLIGSRINYATKMKYMERIHVFEEAFNKRVFEKINY